MRPCSTGWEEHKRVRQPIGPRERLRPFAAWVVLLLAVGAALPVDAAPEGQITWASHVTLVPAWFDPGEASVGSASIVLYALHDALVFPTNLREAPHPGRVVREGRG